LDILKTLDGSSTVYNPDLDETYHSRFGAVTESSHVYIENGLSCWFVKSRKEQVRILEVGLGTGLNALLTVQYQYEQRLSVEYSALEPYPLPDGILHSLGFSLVIGGSDSAPYFDQIHESADGKAIELSSGFSFTKRQMGFEDMPAEESFDIIYFDAFAPNKQPEMWEAQNMRKAYHLTRQAGLLVTYCAKGAVKRRLADAGFKIVTVPGPPGKREMIQAWKE